MSTDLKSIKEDRDVVEPFIERLLMRLRDKHPGIPFNTDNVTVLIEVRFPDSVLSDSTSQASLKLRRMLSDMSKEGVVL